MKLQLLTFALLLVAQGLWTTAEGATVPPAYTSTTTTCKAMGYGFSPVAGYGTYGVCTGTLPVNSPSLGQFSPPPPPPSPGATVTYSTSATVPGVTAVATLTNYATVDAFNSTERTRFVNTLEANILKTLNAVCNISITSVLASSISVTNLYAFTGSDSAAAAAAQASLANVLKSGSVSSVFGSSFGTVTVSGVATTNTTNPATKSGAGSNNLTFLAVAAAIFAVLGSYFML